MTLACYPRAIYLAKKTTPIVEGGVFMKNRFEFNVKGLDIKVDEEYLHMNLFEGRCMI